MFIKELFSGTQSKTANINFTKPSGTRKEIARTLRENQNNMLQEAHEKIRQQQQEQRRKQQQPRRTGAVRLSNTDSLRRARQIRAQLLSKLQEVYGSDMDNKSQGRMAMDIQLQLDRVDRQIAAIRRRERAEEEERTTRRKDDTPEARRRRARDMQERRIYIRRDYLYHANKGGFDPNNPLVKNFAPNALSSVSCEIGGNIAAVDIATPDAGLAADFNLEVVL